VPPPDTSSNRLRGIGLYCLALVSFTVLDAAAKWLGQSLNPLQVVFARYVVSVVLVMALINPWTVPGVLATRAPVLQGVRSVLLFLSTALNFVALQYLQLAETITIVFMTPLVIALIAGPMLGEWVGPRRLIAIGVGFLGVLVVMRPGVGGLHPAALLVVCGVFAYAFYNLLTRKLASVDSSQTTMVWSGFAGVALMLPVIPFVWSWPATALEWALLGLTGLSGAVGHWLVINAHRIAPASTLAPFIYTQLIWMLLAGWLVFGQLPDRWTMAGGLIVVASGLYLLYRERVRGVDVNRLD
jgi:drug/metabolite transporter (DMT)-like permease